MLNDEFGAYYCYYYYYYYISTTDSTAIIVTIFSQSVPECMIMIDFEINGPVTVL